MINDPMSQMARAQKLTITQLQQSLRDGTIDPQVGQIVLASKIKQSKDAKAAMAAQQPAQPPVAQQNMAYGQGVDTLPTNLPVTGMAQGGIIAFEEGGEVIKAANGLPPESFNQSSLSNFMPLTYAQYMTLLPEAKQRYVNQFGAPPAQNTAQQNPLQQAIGIAPPSRLEQMINQGTPLRPQAQAQAKPAVPTGIIESPTAADATKKPDASVDEKLKQLEGYFSGANSVAGGVKTKGGPGIGGFNLKGYETKPYTEAETEMKTMLAEEMNPATKQPWTYAEKAAERLAEMKALGYDPDTLKDQKADLEKRKEKSDKRSKLDEAMPWFAASEAFARQPKPGEAPQSTVGAITGALGAYGKTATELDEKELARQDKLRTEGNALAIAMNAEAQAQYSGNKAELKEAQSAVKAARANLTGLKVKGIDQQNEVAKEVYKGGIELQKSAMAESGAWARLGKENATIQAITKAILTDNPTMSVSDAINKAYLTKGASSIYGADSRATSAQITALTGERKTLMAKRPLMSSQIPAWEAKLKELDNQIAALSGAGTVAAAAPSSDYTGFVDHTKY